MSPLPQNIIRLSPPTEATETRLREAIPTADMLGFVGKADNVPTDAQGRITKRYWVLHPFVGTPHAQPDLADTSIDRDWVFQVTVVGPTTKETLAAASLVDGALYRHQLVIPGLVTGRLRPPDGYDPGPPREDKDYPGAPRFYVPLQYATTISAT